jgi:hypothetical protein
VLGHVKNFGLDYADANTRGYQTSARLPFHTDSADLVALMCLRIAREGGLSSVASSSRIYAEMQARRPDLAEALTQAVCRSRWGEVSGGHSERMSLSPSIERTYPDKPGHTSHLKRYSERPLVGNL